jgi:putative membrane protein
MESSALVELEREPVMVTPNPPNREYDSASPEVRPNSRGRLPLLLLGGVGLALAWSMVGPHDWFTWVLEVAPVLLAAPVLIWTYPRFRFTPLVYTLIAIHAVILIVGGHYTYARVPAGDWVKDALGLARNHYDRLGHIAQGFVPAMIAREILLRTTKLERGKMLGFLCVCTCLAISACYELAEWGAAAATGTAADDFLGSQGDVWDTQKDMLMALIGSLLAIATLSRVHDRQLGRR